MSRLTRLSVTAAVLLVTASVPANATPLPRYVAIDTGTLGGPNAYPNEPGRIVSNTGIVVGSAETPAINPFTQECGNDCHKTDAFEWRNGAMTDLGTLGGYNAGIFELNGSGVGAGFSETGVLDPLTVFPEVHAVTSSNGHIADLGTLGGNDSWASGINDRGQVAGLATNTTTDPDAQVAARFVPYPSATEWHATLWQGGLLRDLGTLGGPDSFGGFLNQRGQAAGYSFVDSSINPATGVPTMHPFLWENGRMRDLGSLGGTFGIANWMNNRGEIAGFSTLSGDQAVHPFLWNGSRMLDLGTLGGDNGGANWVNEEGEVVGSADILGSQAQHGFLWRDGHMTDLPPVDGAPCSNAQMVGDQGLVVGNATDCQGTELNAILWENGTAYNLNNLIPPTPLHLITAEYVNDRGEILTRAVLPNGDNRVVLLVPAAALAANEGLHAASEASIASAHVQSVERRHSLPTGRGRAKTRRCSAAFARLPIARLESDAGRLATCDANASRHPKRRRRSAR